MFGFLNINKPKGMTSHDVISFLRRILKIKQVGHSGTLDPLATGVLPIALGKATRLIEYLSADKEYIALLKLGVISDTYDSEGKILQYSDLKISSKQLESFLPEFTGEISQVPPIYSAVHHQGKRLYELARSGANIEEVPSRNVIVNNVQLIDFNYELQTAKLKINCQKGVYIRSIIHDLGQMLEVGAIMTDLIRTASSGFTINNSIVLDNNLNYDVIKNRLINPIDVLLYNQKTISSDDFNKVKNGASIKNSEFINNTKIILINDEKIVAVGEAEDNLIRICKVFL